MRKTLDRYVKVIYILGLVMANKDLRTEQSVMVVNALISLYLAVSPAGTGGATFLSGSCHVSGTSWICSWVKYLQWGVQVQLDLGTIGPFIKTDFNISNHALNVLSKTFQCLLPFSWSNISLWVTWRTKESTEATELRGSVIHWLALGSFNVWFSFFYYK